MNKNYIKILITFSIIILVAGVYLISLPNNTSNIAYGSSLESSTTGSSSEDDSVSSDTAFLSALASITRIKIDSTLFEEKMFTSLKDNSVNIGTVTPGRDNPFSPVLGTSSSSTSNTVVISKVVTNQPTQITENTAVLNGTINVQSDISSVYFKYGTTNDPVTILSATQSSLVSTFTKSLSELESQTEYFFKACVKINNVETCGDVISFSTN